MQIETINVEQIFENKKNICVDVRTNHEFNQGHILNAVNVPIINETEREKIGIIYKEKGQLEAKKAGIKIVSSKLPEFIEQIRMFQCKNKEMVICCWRGGMRSKATTAVLNLMGIRARQVLGGYKAYRKLIVKLLKEINLLPKIIVLAGSTGVGKTIALKMLYEKGYPVIDLEGLANHRGSVFGKIGIDLPNNTHFFEMNLLNEIMRFRENKYIILECESKRIGNVYLPDFLYEAMQKGEKILFYADIKVRLKRLLEEYEVKKEEEQKNILTAIKSIEKRIGLKKAEIIKQNYLNNNKELAIENILKWYYDPLYGYENLSMQEQSQYKLIIDANDLEVAVKNLMIYLDSLID